VVARPKASEQHWHRVFHNGIVTVSEAHDYRDFYYMVEVKGDRPKYFWGETAYADYQRYAYDKTLENSF
jgi:hypothetical protein